MKHSLLTRLTLAEAIRQDPRMLQVAEALPVMSTTVGDLMTRQEHEHFKDLLASLPFYAIVKGVATNEDRHRVGGTDTATKTAASMPKARKARRCTPRARITPRSSSAACITKAT